jgi:hypothetical protein
LTIGTYIPNIIYINRENARRGGGGGGSGDSQTPQEYTTANNTVQINIDSTGLNSLCVGVGARLNQDGSLVVDPVTGKPIFISEGDNMWSQIVQNKSDITLKVAKGDVATQLSIECGNVSVTGGNLVVDGYVTSAGLSAAISALDYIECGTILADTFGDGSGTVDVGSVTVESQVSCDSLYANEIELGGNTFTNVIVSASVSGNTLTLTPLSGNTITFSKATTVTGSWNGSGTYTATATQNGETVGSAHTTPTLQLNGNGSTSFFAQLLSDDQSQTLQKSIYCYLVQSGTNVNACKNSDGTGIVGSITIPSGGGYTPADIRIGNITNESGSHSTGDGTVLNDLGAAISRAGSRTYVRFIADLNGYSGSGKIYYIPIN